jgi:hypothetical protein
MFRNGINERAEKMNWYLLSLQMYSVVGVMPRHQARRCNYLIAASDHEAAYRKSIELGNHLATETYRFGGVDDLLLIYDAPEHGSELSWSQIEMTPKDLESEVRPKEHMQAFAVNLPSPSGWYVGSVVLCEIHDEGSHGERLLTWINSYLVAAEGAEAAYARVTQIGQERQGGAGSHMCDGEKVHWEFKGIHDIIPIRNAPADGSLLWCDDIEATAEDLKNMLPKKSDLSVFRWAAEQERHTANNRN